MINEMGDKSRAKENMKILGIPVVSGSDGNVKDTDEARIIANEIGYLDNTQKNILVDECDKIYAMLSNLIKARITNT